MKHSGEGEYVDYLNDMNSNDIEAYVLDMLLRLEESKLITRLSKQYVNEYTLV